LISDLLAASNIDIAAYVKSKRMHSHAQQLAIPGAGCLFCHKIDVRLGVVFEAVAIAA